MPDTANYRLSLSSRNVFISTIILFLASFLIFSSGLPAEDDEEIEKIDINNASKKELMSVPGIGEVTAKEIIKNRPYKSLGKLIDIDGIGLKRYKEIRKYLYISRDSSKGEDMIITSPAFEYGKGIPEKYTGEGEDISPELTWTNVPPETEVFVLICDDPDAPVGTWVHWVIYDIPAKVTSLKEGIPMGEDIVLRSAKQGRNDFGNLGYGGPMPPKGKTHRYFFKLYALDKRTGIKAASTKEIVLRAMEDHILAEATLMGTYIRR